MNTDLKQIKKTLRNKGISPTLIRVKILEYMDNNRIHPDADTIYRDLKKDMPVLSKTSVYNTLKLFADNGLTMKLTGIPGKINFDINTKAHFHFVCEACGKFYDVDIFNSVLKKKMIEEHSIREAHGYFKGTCKRCRERSRTGVVG